MMRSDPTLKTSWDIRRMLLRGAPKGRTEELSMAMVETPSELVETRPKERAVGSSRNLREGRRERLSLRYEDGIRRRRT
jgi:hypothetical protein